MNKRKCKLQILKYNIDFINTINIYDAILIFKCQIEVLNKQPIFNTITFIKNNISIQHNKYFAKT